MIECNMYVETHTQTQHSCQCEHGINQDAQYTSQRTEIAWCRVSPSFGGILGSPHLHAKCYHLK